MDAKMLGQRLKEAREKKGLTLEQLGEIVKMPKSNISRLEKGKHGDKYLQMLSKIAEALDTDLNITFEPKS